MSVREIPTKPFEGQKPGTSGLRKKVTVYQQEHYTENFIQAIFDSLDITPNFTLVVGGDGRYYSPEVVQIILRIGAANGVSKFIIGKDTILSTPAASNVIRQSKANGGILLTASHNPGGPKEDFGIKYNTETGGPAAENLTNKMYERTKTITIYKVIEGVEELDLSKVASGIKFGPATVDVIDGVEAYITLLKSIFDFDLIKSFLAGSKGKFQVLFDALHGVTGPYAQALLAGELGIDAKTSLAHCETLPDFGGLHPDPNLTYAHDLVVSVDNARKQNSDLVVFGAACDGDGDRNMIYGGPDSFVNPSDSVAIIAHWAKEAIPYFRQNGINGLARSMPTGRSIDKVAEKMGVEVYEVPTGWKFFVNLMEAKMLSICGEESFGTGSDHIREKDGLWAVFAWLNLIAFANTPEQKSKFGVSNDTVVGIREIMHLHWATYGRSFFSRYDYENCATEDAKKLMDFVESSRASFQSKKVAPEPLPSSGKTFTISSAYDFEYTDPVDRSVSRNQGQVVEFEGGSRVVFRLSGTGSSGATVRMYVEKYVGVEDKDELNKETADGLKDLIEAVLKWTNLASHLKRDAPTVIT